MESGPDELDGTGMEPMGDNSGSTGGPYGDTGARRTHKVDLYSIPVFCLELIILVGLAFVAYSIHFEYQHEPLLSGFYCDDLSYRKQPLDTLITKQFTKTDNELTLTALAVVVPIVIVSIDQIHVLVDRIIRI